MLDPDPLGIGTIREVFQLEGTKQVEKKNEKWPFL